MKMNDTVARIVDLMFDNTEMTEEVTALRDEVMNNCQERFFDLVESGMPEDDAISAVVESLKGMEDVIAQYKRKGRRAAQQPAAEYTAGVKGEYGSAPEYAQPSGHRDMVFSPAEIHRIDLTLVSEDVNLEPSDDGMYHVEWDCDGEEMIACCVNNGSLKVERLTGTKNKTHTTVNFNHKSVKGAHVHVNGEEVTVDKSGNCMDGVDKVMDGVGSMLESLGRSLGRMFSGAKWAFGGCDCVTIRVPECAMPHVRLTTTSGDLDITNVALTDLHVVTTSGDVYVELKEHQNLERAELHSTSGDIEVTAFAQYVSAVSTSGDVKVEGRIQSLNASTISGDIEVVADVAEVSFKAISGDVDVEPTTDTIRLINGSTISGDIDIDLPGGLGYMSIHTQNRSGDVTTRCHTNGVGPTVTGSITSMSGDITIR